MCEWSAITIKYLSSSFDIGQFTGLVSCILNCSTDQFFYRSGGNLNVCGEHVSEVSLFESLNEASVELSEEVQQIVDYTSCESILLDVIGLKNGI